MNANCFALLYGPNTRCGSHSRKKVRLGEHDKRTSPDCRLHPTDDKRKVCAAPHREVAVEQEIIHPGYQHGVKLFEHDIALLRLSRDVDFSRKFMVLQGLARGLELLYPVQHWKYLSK